MKTYYLLTKPGIIFGNLLAAVAGFSLASQGSFDFLLFFETLLGLGLIIAASCVCNNYIDRMADQKMARTRHRPLASGLISGEKALLFALGIGVSGCLILMRCTNWLSLGLALFGFFIYVILYSFWKYKTRFATLVGSLSGALPPVIGYTAVTHQLDTGAFLLFLILVLWQMPHFYSIAMYRYHDYAAALIPVLPVAKGEHATRREMVLYIVGFIATQSLLTAWHYTGSAYLWVSGVLSLAWLGLCLAGFKTDQTHNWAKNMFYLSLVVITAVCVMMTVDGNGI